MYHPMLGRQRQRGHRVTSSLGSSVTMSQQQQHKIQGAGASSTELKLNRTPGPLSHRTGPLDLRGTLGLKERLGGCWSLDSGAGAGGEGNSWV